MQMDSIGLGAMGDPLPASHQGGARVKVIQPHTQPRGSVGGSGHNGVVGYSCRSLHRGVVASMLADDAAVEGVVFGDNGVLAGLPRGGVHISHSTISVNLSPRLADAHAARAALYRPLRLWTPGCSAGARLDCVRQVHQKAVERCHPVLERWP